MDTQVELKTPLPTNADIQTVKLAVAPLNSSPPTPNSTSPFPYLVKMVRLYGVLTEALNTVGPDSHSAKKTAARFETPSSEHGSLVDLEQSITNEYNAFPEEITFNATK